MKRVLQHLRRAALLTAGEGPSDAQLLESFLVRRDEAAFEVLLRRHGPMVLGVCRRVLRNLHDAEDAFQATFLVLARQAGSIRSKEVVASWLYGVAHRTARKARAMNARRRAKERHAGEISHPEASAGGADETLLEQLDHELSRLPDKYRVPVVLCELEGRSRKDVARLLGVPEGTLSWRLAQARKMLAKRLSRQDPLVSCATLATVMAPGTTSAGLRASTIKAVFSAGSVPAKVLALTEGVMKAMLLSKLKITACAAGLMLMAGMGATGLTYRATAQQPALASRPQADELEALRLEIEALRKSLQTTRERVKTLEGEVSALKGQGGGQSHGWGRMPGAAPGAAPSRPGNPAGVPGGQPGGPPGGMRGSGPPGGGPPISAPGGGMPPGMMGSPGAGMMQMGHGRGAGQGMGGMMRKGLSDPLGEAEAALKKLREKPDDTQATEELERALKKLKEQRKRSVPGERTPRGK